jgi:hypothetical protein
VGQQDCIELARLARQAAERAAREEAFWLSMAAERGLPFATLEDQYHTDPSNAGEAFHEVVRMAAAA